MELLVENGTETVGAVDQKTQVDQKTLVFRRGLVRRQEAEVGERARELLRFLNLDRVADERAGRLSGGQKKLLELGRLLMLKPSAILLDEPFAGVNPVLIEELSQRIVELNSQGMAVLIIEHNLDELSRIVPEMYAMDRGQVIAHGTPDELRTCGLGAPAQLGTRSFANYAICDAVIRSRLQRIRKMSICLCCPHAIVPRVSYLRMCLDAALGRPLGRRFSKPRKGGRKRG